jgi:2-methylcitrate dehydratase PrpD
VQDPAITAFQDKVEAIGDPAMAADAAEVTVTLKDRTRHASRVDHCIGSASNPMTDEQLTHKFSDLAEPVLGKARAKELVEQSWAVESMPDVGDLGRAAG